MAREEEILEYNALRNYVRRFTRKSKKMVENNVINNSKSNPTHFWKSIQWKLKTWAGIWDLVTWKPFRTRIEKKRSRKGLVTKNILLEWQTQWWWWTTVLKGYERHCCSNVLNMLERNCVYLSDDNSSESIYFAGAKHLYKHWQCQCGFQMIVFGQCVVYAIDMFKNGYNS